MGLKQRVEKVIEEADILLEVVDARFIEETRNREMEEKIKFKRKALGIVLNKSDLVPEKNLEEIKRKIQKEFPCVYINAKEKKGVTKLKELIGKLGRGKNSKIGFIGYPNTGKSSVINALIGRHAARTAIKAGLTRGEQFIKLNDTIKLIDSPGVIPFSQRDEEELVMLSAKSPNRVKDVELCAEKILEHLKTNFPEKLETMGINPKKEAYELLEDYAIKKKKLVKGGKPDLKNSAMILCLEWQKGKI
ncbi:MAG: 50S ribosome-binding GTPase [Candidatus Diapherotrites archaeon]|nr:50S ribosome-binding GTPase [Candidatus Diapherotrites archaeon]